jgi:hypothetical protein
MTMRRRACDLYAAVWTPPEINSTSFFFFTYPSILSHFILEGSTTATICVSESNGKEGELSYPSVVGLFESTALSTTGYSDTGEPLQTGPS